MLRKLLSSEAINKEILLSEKNKKNAECFPSKNEIKDISKIGVEKEEIESNLSLCF